MFDLKKMASANYNLPYEYIGEVVDNKDLLYRGRLKCKIQGITDETPLNDLPWCETKGELFGSNNTITGVSTAPKIGTLVYIKFLYGNPSFPLVDGYVRGNKDSSNLHKVANLGESIYSTRNSNLIGPEDAPLNPSSIYPFNNVIETDTAVIEIDDTSDNKRISVQHKNGTYFEIRPNGNIQIKAVGDAKVIVDGDMDEFVTGDYRLNVGGNFTANITGTSDTTSGGNMTLNAPRIDEN